MNRSSLLAFGVLVTVLLSLAGLVLIPQRQLGLLQAVKDDTDRVFPAEPAAYAAEGRRVYMDLGCIYCHSQQVRPEGFGADIERGWGTRRSVARDYIHDRPPLLGTMRTGPDLMNIAARQPSRSWHALHLYDPATTSPGSVMPPYRFLFELRSGSSPPRPKLRGAQLIEYLLSLDHSFELPEAK